MQVGRGGGAPGLGTTSIANASRRFTFSALVGSKNSAACVSFLVAGERPSKYCRRYSPELNTARGRVQICVARRSACRVVRGEW
jgi:hypothetical protein